MLKAIISGKPIAAPRPRVTRRGQTYMPATYSKHKDSIIQVLKDTMESSNWKQGEDSPCRLSIRFIHKRPKRMYKTGGRSPKITRPDVDNLTKTVMDSIQSSGLIKDDSQIVELHVIDLYGDKDETPHTEICLEIWK